MHSTTELIIFAVSNQTKQITLKTKDMKKTISAICTAALIIMIPALFIAYLYNNGISNSRSVANKAKTETLNAKQETGFRPGQMAFLKG